MATTTNYGFEIPDDTDLVKDGALAMRDLGQDVDTTLFSVTGGKNVGYQFISTTTFSGASTVTVDNVFTSAYDNYKIVGNFLNSSAAYIMFRVRAAGTTRATGYRVVEGGSAQAGATEIRFGYNYTNAGNYSAFEQLISNPAIASRKTSLNGLQIGQGDSTGFIQPINGFYNTAEANDGFLLFPQSGTFTGEVSVYGLKD
jgi:hypothetical protein